MKLTFLGTATSTGIPVLGCHCEVCQSNDSRDHRLRCCSLLTTDTGRNILIDCGPDIRHQLLTTHNSEIGAVILTHSHYDHIGGLDDLRTLSYKRPIDIYCSSDVADDVRRVMPYCFSGANYPNIPRLVLHEIRPYEVFNVCETDILPLRVVHGRLPILGFRIGNLVYITDATEIPEETINKIKNIEVLIINALRKMPNPTHMNLEQALRVIDIVKPREAYLIHMSHQMGMHAVTSLELHPGVRFAYDGLQVQIM